MRAGGFMQANFVDPTRLGERFAAVRRAYGESIDLPNLGSGVFAAMLGVSVSAYESYERGEREPTIEFLLALRVRTGITLDWLLERTDWGGVRRFGDGGGRQPSSLHAIPVSEPVAGML
ncbi:MAG TPA: helix-turn-helix domain-containing protein [Acetobacteraceae bacterium]|nr:helix-turn-helix domain-containing protein [Acetobacteraceae bacterium]